MNPMYGLTADEHRVLRDAMEAPIETRDPVSLGICLKLCGLKLLQRAGAAATLNGWRGSPSAFFLTRDGWTLLKEERTAAPLWRTA